MVDVSFFERELQLHQPNVLGRQLDETLAIKHLQKIVSRKTATRKQRTVLTESFFLRIMIVARMACKRFVASIAVGVSLQFRHDRTSIHTNLASFPAWQYGC